MSADDWYQLRSTVHTSVRSKPKKEWSLSRKKSHGTLRVVSTQLFSLSYSAIVHTLAL